MIDQRKVGLFIAELRKERELTQDELAAMLYVGREAVSKWERGVGLPSHTVLLELSEVFDITINELLYGERLNKQNKKAIDVAVLRWIDKITSKVNKWKRLFIVTILLAVIIYFISYFILNYNSFKVYTTYASGDTFTIKQGLIIICREKMYIQFGDIINHTNEDIIGANIYYKKDTEKVLLLSANELNEGVIDTNKIKSIANNKSISDILSNTYIEIKTKNTEEIEKIKVDLDFKDTFIFKTKVDDSKEDDEGISLQSDNKLDINIDNVKKKFKLKNGEYIYEFKYNGKKYKCRMEDNIIYLLDLNNDFRYDFSSNKIIILGEHANCSYDLHSLEHKSGVCEDYVDIINIFIENILS